MLEAAIEAGADDVASDAEALGILFGKIAPIVTAFRRLEPGAAATAERRAGSRGAVVGGFVGFAADRGLGADVEVVSGAQAL